MEGIPSDQTPVPNPTVISREGLNNHLVLVNCDTGISLALNSTGGIVWNLIRAGYNGVEIISTLCKRFKISPELASDEVNTLFLLLAKEGFIGYEIRE